MVNPQETALLVTGYRFAVLHRELIDLLQTDAKDVSVELYGELTGLLRHMSAVTRKFLEELGDEENGAC